MDFLLPSSNIKEFKFFIKQLGPSSSFLLILQVKAITLITLKALKESINDFENFMMDEILSMMEIEEEKVFRVSMKNKENVEKT